MASGWSTGLFQEAQPDQWRARWPAGCRSALARIPAPPPATAVFYTQAGYRPAPLHENRAGLESLEGGLQEAHHHRAVNQAEEDRLPNGAYQGTQQKEATLAVNLGCHQPAPGCLARRVSDLDRGAFGA